MLDQAPTVVFRPYVYELIDNGDGQYTLWYSLWIPMKDGITARSVTVDFIAASNDINLLRMMCPEGWCIVGRGDGDPEALLEVWMDPEP